MKLEINTNGAWRTVLRDLTGGDLSIAKDATEELCDVAYRRDTRLSFRLAGNNGEVLARCDSTDCVWMDAEERKG